MRPSRILLSLCVLAVFGQAQTTLPAPDTAVDLTALKQMEVDRLRAMAEAGAIPRARLDQAQAELADANDNMILRRTLYGTVRVEDFNKDQSTAMVEAAERLVERQQERYEKAKELVTSGVMARVTLTAMLEDLEFRRKTLDLARFRARLVDELEAQARIEEEADAEAAVMTPRRVIERYDGRGIFTMSDFARISSAFQQRFFRELPVSAHGETATHRALGFDHRGRIDIALSPDQREGQWLINFLRRSRIPYYAFRAAVRGKSTAPHIHIGPPSLRLRVAD